MKKRIFSFFLAVLLIAAFPVSVFGNSAEPAFFTVIVENPPAGLDVLIDIEGTEFESDIEIKFPERYYRFFESDLYTDFGKVYDTKKAVLIVRNGETELRFGLAEFFGEDYGVTAVLDLEKETLEEAQSSFRTIKLVALRVGLTLLLEGIIFFLFRMRKAKSWIVFIITNLITQIFLNVQLSLQGGFGYGATLLLIMLEVLILLVEGIAFGFLVPEFREKFGKQGFAVLYSTAANIASWILGGFLISNLPV